MVLTCTAATCLAAGLADAGRGVLSACSTVTASSTAEGQQGRACPILQLLGTGRFSHPAVHLALAACITLSCLCQQAPGISKDEQHLGTGSLRRCAGPRRVLRTVLRQLHLQVTKCLSVDGGLYDVMVLVAAFVMVGRAEENAAETPVKQ